MTLVKIGTRSRIPPPEGRFQISFSEHTPATDQDIFTKFGGYVDELPQGVEWSEHVFFTNLICQMAAMYQACN